MLFPGGDIVKDNKRTRTRPNASGATILVLGAGRAQVPAIRKALDLGLKVVAIDPDKNAPGLALARFTYSLDLADCQSVLDLARKHEIAAVLTMAADYPMPTVAYVCAEMGLAGPSVDSVAMATNKRLMREALSGAGVQCPRFVHASSLTEAKHALAALKSEAIFKPAMSQGGRGITRVSAGASEKTIEDAFQRAITETRADGVMIEELTQGPEYSVETLTYRGETHVIAVTDKLTSGPPYFVELGHNQPSRSPADQVELLGRVAAQSISAVRVDQSAGHTEIRMSPDGPVVMEVAARLGGGFISSHLVPISTGIDLVSATIQTALGDQPDLKPVCQPRAAAIRFLMAKPGIVTDIEGVATGISQDGVDEIDIYVKSGSQVRELVDASCRPGHVICSALSPEQAISLADRVATSVVVQTAPVE